MDEIVISFMNNNQITTAPVNHSLPVQCYCYLPALLEIIVNSIPSILQWPYLISDVGLELGEISVLTERLLLQSCYVVFSNIFLLLNFLARLQVYQVEFLSR